jgi:hypothetical protein
MLLAGTCSPIRWRCLYRPGRKDSRKTTAFLYVNCCREAYSVRLSQRVGAKCSWVKLIKSQYFIRGNPAYKNPWYQHHQHGDGQSAHVEQNNM